MATLAARLWARSDLVSKVEACVHFRPEVYAEGGEVTEEETAGFLRNFMQEFRTTHLERTVIPSR